VYKGVDRQRGAEVAWNKLRPSVSEADFQRLYEEVRLLQSLHHERIIHFVHSWLDMENKQLVFITEYMTSGTLRRYGSIYFWLWLLLLLLLLLLWLLLQEKSFANSVSLSLSLSLAYVDS